VAVGCLTLDGLLTVLRSAWKPFSASSWVNWKWSRTIWASEALLGRVKSKSGGQHVLRPGDRVTNNGLPTVVIADDNREILKVLAKLLRPSYRIVAQAEDGGVALRAIQPHQPQLAILDISMPTMNGLEVAGQLWEAKFYESRFPHASNID
jgi:hypothetical protein